jgi:serine/threonine protein phosphatase PrpC
VSLFFLFRTLVDGDDFLVIASDGLWDTVTSQEAADIVFRCVEKMGLQSCAEVLTATAMRKGSMDNITVLVIDLRCHRASRGPVAELARPMTCNALTVKKNETRRNSEDMARAPSRNKL